MRAVVRREYGGPEVLRVEEVEAPTPGSGEVLIRVAAAGVNMAEWHLMAGDPLLVKLALGMPRPRRHGLGADVAGLVEAVGPGVTRFAVGDAVFGSGRATWAELAVAEEDALAPLPAGVPAEQAAAVPMAGYTALQALRVVGDLTRRHVAVTGAGGGVGSMIVQLAAARGARVTAVCSAAKAEFVRRLGAHDVIDYRATDPTDGERRFDAVLDFAGGLPLRRWRRVVRPAGVLVLGGAENGGAVLGPLGRALGGVVTRGLKTVLLMADSKPDDIRELGELLASGELRSTVSRTYPLEAAGRAVDDLRAARHPGKVVLVPIPATEDAR